MHHPKEAECHIRQHDSVFSPTTGSMEGVGTALRVGVDVGGTNTDAVVMRGTDVLGWCKATTTHPDVKGGLRAAVEGALRDAITAHDEVDASQVRVCMLGTTQFVNALVQRKGLGRVAVLRLCLPAASDLPPFSDMPADVIAAVGGGAYRMVHGGLEYDGESEISIAREDEVLQAASELLEGPTGFSSIVISAVFAPLNPEKHETWAAAVVASKCPHVTVTQSSQVSSMLGLLERENAAVLNASLRPLASQLLPQCHAAFASCLPTRPPLFFTSNDGTLLSPEAAEALPIATFQSGPVNSIRGAAYLCQHHLPSPPHTICTDAHGDAQGKSIVVVDVGGTTTDFGLIEAPRPPPSAPHAPAEPITSSNNNTTTPTRTNSNQQTGSTTNVTIARQQRICVLAGVPTNLPLPATESIGLGGGSIVRRTQTAVRVGPTSVGAELLRRCVNAGGTDTTATDVAIAVGAMNRCDLGLEDEGNGGGVRRVDKALADEAWREIQTMIEEGVDRAKVRSGPVDVVVVGGGAPLVGPSIRGAARVVRPPFAQVANAIGAAIPQVGFTLDQVVLAPPDQRSAIVDALEKTAMEKVVAAGGSRETCQVAWREQVPLAYLPGHALRFRMRVLAELDMARSSEWATASHALSTFNVAAQTDTDFTTTTTTPAATQHTHTGDDTRAAPSHAHVTHKATSDEAWERVFDASGEWVVTERDIKAIAVGCGVLGAGGGGSPHLAELQVLRAMKETGRSVRVVPLHALADECVVIEGSMMGAPTVCVEKLYAGEAQAAFTAAARMCEAQGKSVYGVLVGEIGGGNGLQPLHIGLRLGLPVVDADLMGRAFPELQMMTSCIYGLPPTPATLADEKGNALTVSNTMDAEWLERLLRPVCTAMGCSAGFSSRPLSGQEAKRYAVPQSLSLAWRLGRAILRSHLPESAVEGVIRESNGGRMLFEGKVVDVVRETSEGFARGHVVLQEMDHLRAHGQRSPRVYETGVYESGAMGQAVGGGAGRGGEGGRRRTMRVEFQNENLVARVLTSEGNNDDKGEMVCCVPDLIVVLEMPSALPLQTEDLRYGLRACVLGLPCHPLLKTPEALAVVGPQAFKYTDVEYTPIV